ENDREILELFVEKCSVREVERHAHDLTAARIDVERSDHARLPIIFWPDLDLVDVDGFAGKGDAKTVGDREVVLVEAGLRERMRHVTHLVALAQPNDVRKVVLNDAEVVAVVLDVGGEQQGVAAALDDLLAEIGRSPVDCERQLVRLYDAWRLGESFTHL